MIEGWAYQTALTALIPYDKAWPVFPDGLLGHLYLRSKQDGILETVFDPGMDFDGFVSYFANKKVAMQVYALKRDDALIPAGYCWVDDVVGIDGARRAMFGFAFFKEYRRMREIADMGWLCLKYWFDALKITVLFGVTEDGNTAAKNFAKRYGFREVTTVDEFMHRRGTLVSAKVVTLTAAEFAPLF